MSENTLIVENISKKYGDKLVLDNVSFTAKKGEVVGVIGPNGAGKSTLLKILSGNTKPNNGRITINGRIISILEIGAGFHPELSGLENLNLTAGLYGFKKNEIAPVLEKIIAFSEASSYINDPVKTYSNGMYLRVAFSFFIHMDFDILLLDEVLGVGDASFKQKIREYFDTLVQTDKTIILVSHNLNEITSFCNRFIYINKCLKKDSRDSKSVIIEYLSETPEKIKELDSKWSYRGNKNLIGSISSSDDLFLKSIFNEHIVISKITLSSNSEVKKKFKFSENILIEIEYEKKMDESNLDLALKLFDINDNEVLFDSYFMRNGYELLTEKAGLYKITVEIPSNLLSQGRYFINLLVLSKELYVSSWHGISSFDIEFDEWMKEKVWSKTSSLLLPRLAWKKESTL